MDYKKFRDINALMLLIGTGLSAVLSIVMMFFPEEHVSINFLPFMLFAVIVNARTIWLTSQKEYNAEEYIRSVSEPAFGVNAQLGKTIVLITVVSGCITVLLSLIKIFVH